MPKALWVKSARWANTTYYQIPVSGKGFMGCFRSRQLQNRGHTLQAWRCAISLFLFSWARRQKSEHFKLQLDFQFLLEKLRNMGITSHMPLFTGPEQRPSPFSGVCALQLATSLSTPYYTARPVSFLVPQPHRLHNVWEAVSARNLALPGSHHDQAKEILRMGHIS